MPIKIENQPDKDTIVARKALKSAMSGLLRQRKGLNLDTLISKECGVEVTLNFDDGRKEVPGSVLDFIDSQYPNRSIALEAVKYHFHKSVVRDGWYRILKQRDVPLIEIEVAHLDSIGGLEREREYKDVVLPGQDLVRSTTILLLIYNTPMTYFISESTMREWISGRSLMDLAKKSKEDEEVEQRLDPKIAFALTSLLPDRHSKTPLLDKIADLTWLPIKLRAPLHELRRKRLMKEDPHFDRFNLPRKSIAIYC